MKGKALFTIAGAMFALAVLSDAITSAQDKYGLKVTGGLAFAECRRSL